MYIIKRFSDSPIDQNRKVGRYIAGIAAGTTLGAGIGTSLSANKTRGAAVGAIIGGLGSIGLGRLMIKKPNKYTSSPTKSTPVKYQYQGIIKPPVGYEKLADMSSRLPKIDVDECIHMYLYGMDEIEDEVINKGNNTPIIFSTHFQPGYPEILYDYKSNRWMVDDYSSPSPKYIRFSDIKRIIINDALKVDLEFWKDEIGDDDEDEEYINKVVNYLNKCISIVKSSNI